MFKGFKIKIYPTQEQANFIINSCNVARYVYNWTIATEKDNYEKGEKFLSNFTLHKRMTQFKKQPENYWLKEVSNKTLVYAINDAVTAYKLFFKGIKNYPKFKKKNKSKMSFGVRQDKRFVLEEDRVLCEKLGWIKTKKHNIPLNQKYFTVRISFDGDNFWLGLCVEYPDDYFYINNQSKTEPIGIDLGLKTLAVCSNGKKLRKPNVKKYQKRIKRLRKKASRKYEKMLEAQKKTKIKFSEQIKSKNLLKVESKIRKDYRRINDILTSNIHLFTKKLIEENPKSIIIENLNVNGMMQNKNLSSKLMEAKFYEFRRQLEYKCKWYGIDLILADRWYPSSKICSCCGNKKKILKLSERIYKCEKCGLIIDRDYNAALNLRNLAL